MKKILIILLLSISLVGCSSSSYKTIDQEEAYKAMSLDDSIVVIDVRTEEEYSEEHIVDAINIPLDNIESIDLDKNTTIYVYCQSGNRSKEAAQKLYELGYSNVYDMGGIDTWTYETE